MAGGGWLAAESGAGVAGRPPDGVDAAATVACDRGVAGSWVAVGAAPAPQAIPAAKTQAHSEANHQRRLGLPWLLNRVP